MSRGPPGFAQSIIKHLPGSSNEVFMNEELFPFRMNSEFDDRRDPKWAHPLVKDDYQGKGIENSSEYILDPAKTIEEIQSFRNIFLNAIAEAGETFMSENQVAIRNKGTFTEHKVPGLKEGDPDIRTRIWIPNERKKKRLPVIFHIYGGALINGSIEMCESEVMWMNRDAKCALVSTSYRPAPDCKYPANVDDLQAQYKWVLDHADEFGFDVNRMVIAGASTGGQLSAALAFRIKKVGLKRPRGLILMWPIIDDRQMTASSRYRTNMWDAEIERGAFKAWLGDNVARSDVAPDAVPGHAKPEDFIGYPPTVIHCMEHDIDRDDVIRFAQSLLNAGIFCDFKLWGGQSHLSLSTNNRELRDRFEMLVIGALNDFINFDFSRPWTENK